MGAALKKGDIVVYESTGLSRARVEEECAPILEECSALEVGTDFNVGYIRRSASIPGMDKQHRLGNRS